MIRLFIGTFVALALLVTPIAATARTAQAGDMQGCVIGGKMPASPAAPENHLKMPCCAVVCQVPWATALLADAKGALSSQLAGKAMVAWPPVKQLHSISSSALDPPPRA